MAGSRSGPCSRPAASRPPQPARFFSWRAGGAILQTWPRHASPSRIRAPEAGAAALFPPRGERPLAKGPSIARRTQRGPTPPLASAASRPATGSCQLRPVARRSRSPGKPGNRPRIRPFPPSAHPGPAQKGADMRKILLLAPALMIAARRSPPTSTLRRLTVTRAATSLHTNRNAPHYCLGRSGSEGARRRPDRGAVAPPQAAPLGTLRDKQTRFQRLKMQDPRPLGRGSCENYGGR